MSRLLGLAIVAVVIYFAITRGMPWLETAMGSSGGAAADGESAACVSEASAATDVIADELIPNARPPVDSGIWGTALVRAGRALAAAENACSCPTSACAKGYEGVHQLRALFDELDDMARGNPMGFGNPARRMERVYELLAEARELARSE